MKTIKDVFESFKLALALHYDAREAEAIALTVLEELTGFSRAKIKAFPEEALTPHMVEKLTAILNELKSGKPVQYILGSTEFYGLTFLVNPSVLIPRPETEELVEWILAESKNSKIKTKKPVNILDIGTGSGCIAISLKKNLPNAMVTAIDISAGALDTATQNAVINKVNVNFINQDILEAGLSGGEKENTSSIDIQQSMFDIIVSNPPYVTLDDKLQMHTNVTDFEPHSALFVPEHDPLIFYKAISAYATKNLNPGGLLFFEINENLGKETVDLLADNGFTDIKLRQDMSGRDRIIKATADLND